MKLSTIATTLCIIAIAGCHFAPAVAKVSTPRIPHFAMTLEHAPTGAWTAQCEAGCKWKTVTTSCGGCEFRLDDSGISPATATEPAHASFAFALRQTKDGAEARAISGTAWTRLTWRCAAANGYCRAILDEKGVFVPAVVARN